jgi:hypothetical protein
MAEETFDFGAEEAWEPKDAILPPDWTGEVIIDDVEAEESSGSHPQVRLQLRATNGDGELRDWITITPNSLGHWLQICEAFGVENPGQIAIRDNEDRDQNFPAGRPTKAWLEHILKFGGRTAHIKTYTDTSYDPQGRTKVQFYSATPLFDGEQVPADSTGLGNGGSGKKVPF